MGIPSYFASIVRKYPDVIQKLQTVPTQQFGRLFIDFNCIIHKCAYNVCHKHINANLHEIETKVINESIDFLQNIINHINPSNLIYIAVDGVCPRSKMTQQRKRRFISSWKESLIKNTEYKKFINDRWNSNIVTPGTQFMDKLNDKMVKTFGSREKVIFSGSDAFGEGEHKIFNYIRQNQNNDSNMIDLVYGLDADLILLGLLRVVDSHGNFKIMLLRENMVFQKLGFEDSAQEELILMDLNRLFQKLLQYYSPNSDYNTNSEFIRDYVILCTFLGNDFLPPLSFIKVKENSIDMLIKMYLEKKQINGIEQNNTESKSLVIQRENDFVLNWKFLHTIIKDLAKVEDEHMQNAYNKYHNRHVPNKDLFDYKKIMHDFDHFPVLHKVPKQLINPFVPGWRINYYRELFPEQMSLNTICQKYCEGLQWVIDYYIKQEPMLNWHYPFCYSPSILDFSNFLNIEEPSKPMTEIDNNTFIEFTKDKNLQLLMVLPPASLSIIPDKTKAQLMTNINKGCVHYFPQMFRISTFLKTYIWECSAILPEIDILHLYKTMNPSMQLSM